MSRSEDVFLIGTTRINVGLSAITTVTGRAFQLAGSFKIISGGSLEIVNGPSTGWGAGYLMGTSEVVNFAGPAQFYLAASGATVVVGLNWGYSAGTTVT